MSETTHWKVQGMSCTNCALSIEKYLEKQGQKNVKVNFIGGDVSFDKTADVTDVALQKGISSLGYKVVNDEEKKGKNKLFFADHLQRFWFCLIFTLPLLLHMVGLHIHWLMNSYVQLALTIPVFIVGMGYFGRSAIKSVSKGVPNMNVLITIGAIASFVYSLYGTLTHQAEQYLFYETTATIITLVFLGNWLEDKSVQTTQTELQKLAVSQKLMANMIAYDDKHEEHVFPVESSSLKVGDLLLIKTGEQVPADCKVLWGEASVSEAIITGESAPVEKKMNDKPDWRQPCGKGNNESLCYRCRKQHRFEPDFTNGSRSTNRKTTRAATGRQDQRHLCSGGGEHRSAYVFRQLFFCPCWCWRKLVARNCGIGNFMSLRYGFGNARGHCCWLG